MAHLSAERSRHARLRRRHDAKDARAMRPHLRRLAAAGDGRTGRAAHVDRVGAPHEVVRARRLRAIQPAKLDAPRELRPKRVESLLQPRDVQGS